MFLDGGASGKEPTCQCRRHRNTSSISGSGRSPGGGHGNPFQYFCLENPMDRGPWKATVKRVTKNQTRLKQLNRAKQSTESMQSLLNDQLHFSKNQNKKLSICMETQKTPNSQINLEKEKQSWGNQPTRLQIILQTTIIKTIQYWNKNRNIDQLNKIGIPEINSDLLEDKGQQSIN